VRVKQIIRLVQYIKDQDVFEGHYRRDLHKRMLSEGRDSDEALERSVLAELRALYGVQLTSRLLVMLNDRRSSADVVKPAFDAFRKHRAESADAEADAGPTKAEPPPPDFSVNVLTLGVWPTSPNIPVQLPAPMVACMEEFAAFYLGSEMGRSKRLAWRPREGVLQVKATYASGKSYDLVSIPLQLVPLLAMQAQDRLEATLEEVRAWTGLSLENLVIIFREMERLKLVHVLPEAEGRECLASGAGAGARVRVNADFSSPKRKVVLPSLLLEEDRARGDDMHAELDVERKEKLKCIIVRVMKTRQLLGHSELVAEAYRGCTHFEPAQRMIKTAIEECITQEYLRRRADDVKIIEYVP
jgi:hypothetical protein